MAYEDGKPIPGTEVLADAMTRRIVEKGEDPDAVMRWAEDAAPYAVLGAATMEIVRRHDMEAADMSSAFRALRRDRKLQRHILAILEQFDTPPQQHTSERPDVDRKRLAALRREASEKGSIQIANLRVNEPLTLEYKKFRLFRKRPLHGFVEVARDQRGRGASSLSMHILDTHGDIVDPMLDPGLERGRIVYFGYIQANTRFASQLRPHTPAVWATGLSDAGYRGLQQAPNFMLEQIYYGQSRDYPLFETPGS